MTAGTGKVSNIGLGKSESGAKWSVGTREGSVSLAKGHAFFKGVFLDSAGLSGLFLEKAKTDFPRFTDTVKELNGNFALILKSGGNVFAAVDRIRSYPLFFGERKGSFTVDDNARNVRSAIEADTINPHAVEEFLMSGYVSSGETLYYGIRQLRAGEALSVLRDAPGDLSIKRYYTFYGKDKNRDSAGRLIDIYDEILGRAFARLLESAKGRKIVVPLSGGVDSRLIVSMLKKSGYKDVLCLSYGVPGNWETRISRKVAERIGYEWLYAPYSRKKWRDTYRSRQWKDYFYSQDNLSSLPNGDEWIALEWLKRKKAIPDDAVFVPGHTGDFVTGGHLQYIFGGGADKAGKQDLIDSILNKHYSLWPSKLSNAGLKEYLTGKLGKYFDNIRLDSEQDIADAYEYWEWQERQAKFIVNAVRTYDFWGYEWRLPFWDSEVMDFWSAIPLGHKLGKRLYLAYLEKKDEFGLFGGDMRRKRLDRRRLVSGRSRKFLEYFRDTKGIYGIKNYFEVTLMNYGRRNANSILVKDYIKTILNGESIGS